MGHAMNHAVDQVTNHAADCVAECAGRLEEDVLEAFSRVNGLMRHIVVGRDFGLTKAQEVAMMALYFNERLTVGQIADWADVTREQASRIVRDLEARGLVEKRRSKDNWRAVDIVLTQEGHELAERMRSDTAGRLHALLGCLTDDEAARLGASARDMCAVLAALPAGAAVPQR